jgi:SAM-dependent methyltransferase
MTPGSNRPMDATSWDDRYRGSDLVWGAGPNRFLVEEIGTMAPGTALDVACGEGRNAIWLAEQGWRVTGVDFSSVALDKARAFATDRGVGVDWVRADLTNWEPPSAYDLVIVFYLQLSANLRRRVLSRMAESVAPGGTLLVVAHDHSNLTEGHGGPQDPAVLYRPDDVAADVVNVLRIVRAERVRRPVDTADGLIDAIDLLVRAKRVEPAGAPDR